MKFRERCQLLVQSPPVSAADHAQVAADLLAGFAETMSQPNPGGYMFTPPSLTMAQAHAQIALVLQQGLGRDYVAVHRDDDLPLILELLDFEKETAAEQLRDHEHNAPEFVLDDMVRLAYATEVYDRLKEQL